MLSNAGRESPDDLFRLEVEVRRTRLPPGADDGRSRQSGAIEIYSYIFVAAFIFGV